MKKQVKNHASQQVQRIQHDLSAPYRVTKGKRFRLKDFDPSDLGEFGRALEREHEARLREGVELLSELQEKLYAQDRWSVLLIFQAMDAAGKDGTIKHVMSGVNPVGCQVFSFKAPSPQELDHDWMWRTNVCLPERGRIGIFNRSYYEEVLIVRVRPELLAQQHLPPGCIDKHIWTERFGDIVNHERYLHRNGILVLKFFLNLSKAEQRRRFLARIAQPDKNWKFEGADIASRAMWNDYMRAYEDMVRHTATKRAPWFVVPADNKWYTRLVVVGAITDALLKLDLSFPRLGSKRRKELAAARAALLAER